MKVFTLDEVISYDPCYTDDELIQAAGGRTSLTVWEVLDLRIPAEDRVWLALRDGEHTIPAARRIVDRMVRHHALHCRIKVVEQWAEAWLSGKDRSKASALAAERAAGVKDRVEVAAVCSAGFWLIKKNPGRVSQAAAVAAISSESVGRLSQREEVEYLQQVEDIRAVVSEQEKE